MYPFVTGTAAGGEEAIVAQREKISYSLPPIRNPNFILLSCQSKVLLLILSRVLLLLHKIHVPSFYSLAEFLIWGVELRIVAWILGGHLLLLSITFRTGHLYFSAHITHMILLNKRCEKNPAASALSTNLFYRFMSWIYLLFEERQLTRGYWNSVHQTHFLPPNLCVGERRVAPHDDQTRSLHRPCLAKERVGVAPSNQKMSLVISSIMRDVLSKISASAENYARFRHPTRWTRPCDIDFASHVLLEGFSVKWTSEWQSCQDYAG
jgi:hypothetical protein